MRHLFHARYLCHLFPVGLGVQWGFSEQDGVLLRGHTQLIVEGVMPDLLHVVPVGDDAVLDGVLQSEDTSLALGLISHIAVLLTHTHHHTLEKRIVDGTLACIRQRHVCLHAVFCQAYRTQNERGGEGVQFAMYDCHGGQSCTGHFKPRGGQSCLLNNTATSVGAGDRWRCCFKVN